MSRFVFALVILGGSLCFGADSSAVSSNSVTTQGLVKNLTKDGLTKRGVKEEDLSANGYDPPPEYYRGPASSSSYHTGDRDNTLALAGYPSRPVAFPDGKYGYKGGSWPNNDAGQQERKGLNDRVSVGHYSSGLSHSGYGSGNHGYGGSTTAHPYGPPQAVEYEYYTPTGNGHGYSDGGEGIPVELYNRGYGSYGGHGNYGGHGGEYSTYTVTTGHDGGGAGHGGGGGHGGGHGGAKHGYDKALLAKSFLIPLASAAVLGIAAALASNPLLLQLGTVSSIGKRKRRELDEKIVHSMAYRRQRRN